MFTSMYVRRRLYFVCMLFYAFYVMFLRYFITFLLLFSFNIRDNTEYSIFIRATTDVTLLAKPLVNVIHLPVDW